MKKCAIKHAAALLSLLFAASSADAAVIDSVIVRQQWPWSTDVKIEYRITGVTSPVKIEYAFYNGNTVLEPENPVKNVRGDIYVAKSGTGTIVVDPVAAFGKNNKALGDFRVRLSVGEIPEGTGDIEEVLYKIFDLDDGSCTDVTRADILGGAYGSYETDFARLGSGFNTSVENVLVWTGVTNDIRYATDKLVMRKIPAAGKVWSMGSPVDEEGREDTYSSVSQSDNLKQLFGTIGANTETQHQVTMTNDYFIGVFEVTQAQYAKIVAGHECQNGNTYITDAWPSYMTNALYRATRPVENVSYAHIRGLLGNGACWPEDSYSVESWSFVGLLRDRLGDVPTMDLPTEAQWEFACRAGTTGGLNSGLDILHGHYEGDVNLGPLGRSRITGAGGGNVGGTQSGNRNAAPSEGGTARVGSFLPNAYGLYDMHGNVCEWCLDFFEDFTADAAVEPTGPVRRNENWSRVLKSGCWSQYARYCRSAFRAGPSYGRVDGSIGFRLCMTVSGE